MADGRDGTVPGEGGLHLPAPSPALPAGACRHTVGHPALPMGSGLHLGPPPPLPGASGGQHAHRPVALGLHFAHRQLFGHPGTSLRWRHSRHKPGQASSVCGEEGQGLTRAGAGDMGPPGAWLTLLARGPRVAIHTAALPGDGVTVSPTRAVTAQDTARPEEAPCAVCRTATATEKGPSVVPVCPSQGPPPSGHPLWGVMREQNPRASVSLAL